MKKAHVTNIITMLFLAISTCLHAQNYTESYNPLTRKYELKDHTGKIIGTKAWNSFRQEWEIELFSNQNQNNGTRLAPIESFTPDFSFYNNTLSQKQSQYNSALVNIQGLYKDFSDLYTASNSLITYYAREMTDWKEKMDEIINSFNADQTLQNGFKSDLSNATNYNIVLARMNSYISDMRMVYNELYLNKKYVQSEIRALQKKFNTSIRLSDGWYQLTFYTVIDNDYFDDRNKLIYIQSGVVTSFIYNDTSIIDKFQFEKVHGNTVKFRLKGQDVIFIGYLEE